MGTGQLNVTDNVLRMSLIIINNNCNLYIYIKLNVYNLEIFNSKFGDLIPSEN